MHCVSLKRRLSDGEKGSPSGRRGIGPAGENIMASEQNCIEIRVSKIHDGEWVWKNNVWCPRKNEEYSIWLTVVNSDILTSGTEDEMIEFLSRWGFDYVPGKVYYGR